MTARYKGEIVRVIRIEARHAYIVWRKMVKRVNPADLIDVTLIAGLVASLALLAWQVLR
jgi:hypothetical protein